MLQSKIHRIVLRYASILFVIWVAGTAIYYRAKSGLTEDAIRSLTSYMSDSMTNSSEEIFGSRASRLGDVQNYSVSKVDVFVIIPSAYLKLRVKRGGKWYEETLRWEGGHIVPPKEPY